MADEAEVTDDELMQDLFETVSYIGTRPWRDVLGDEDDDDDGPVAVNLSSDSHRGSFLVSVPVPSPVATRLAVVGGVDPDEMHITLCYLPKMQVDMLTPDAVEDLPNIVRDVVKSRRPFDVEITGPGRFEASSQSDGRDVFYAKVKSDALHEMRAAIYAALVSAGASPSKLFAYNPHITIRYMSAGEDVVDDVSPMSFRVTDVIAGKTRIQVGRQLEKQASALSALSALPKVIERGQTYVKTSSLFALPRRDASVPLNRKTTASTVARVPLAEIAPSQALVSVDGVSRYISHPRLDPPDVVRFESADGSSLVATDGHTRLSAALLRKDESMEVRVWHFTYDDRSGQYVPVPRGFQRRAKDSA